MSTIQDLQNLIGSLAQQTQNNTDALNTLITSLTTNTGTIASIKPTTAKPEKFSGEAGDVDRFLAFFVNWAMDQKDLTVAGVRDDEKWIKSAIQLMEGKAAIWAAPYAAQIAQVALKVTGSKYPFEGNFEKFGRTLATHFDSVDIRTDSRLKLQQLTQGSKTASQYAQRFQELASKTGFSDEDLRHRFTTGLTPALRRDLAVVEAANTRSDTLDKLVERAVKLDFDIRGATEGSTASGGGRDSNAMEVDATRTDGVRTHNDYMNAMRGKCFGCAQTGHVKANCTHRTSQCPHCNRQGHILSACEDRYRGFPAGGRRNGRPQRNNNTTAPAMQVNATVETTPAAPAASATTASSTTPGQDFHAVLATLQEQNRANQSAIDRLLASAQNFQ